MAVLGRQAILQAIDDGLIAITPFSADHVGPASVDLTLGSTFRVFRKVHEVIEVRDHTDYRECTDKLEIPKGGHILINFGPAPLAVVPGTLICQFIFQRMDGEEHYAGRFAGQSQSSF
jgi:dCTP deaminase